MRVIFEGERFGRLTIEQIGRELRIVYPASENLPQQLRTLADELERKIMTSRQMHSHRETGGTAKAGISSPTTRRVEILQTRRAGRAGSARPARN